MVVFEYKSLEYSAKINTCIMSFKVWRTFSAFWGVQEINDAECETSYWLAILVYLKTKTAKYLIME